MRVAFYAPMKPLDDPRPSGDREMARLLREALGCAGWRVESACRFSSYDGAGDPIRQRRLAVLGGRMAAALIRRQRRRSACDRAKLWFTYHLYHKAPDHLGPAVSRALAIPYVVAEASHAPKRAHGRWAIGHAAAAEAIAAADLVIGLNSADAQCVRPLLPSAARLVPLAPFIDTAAFTMDETTRLQTRASLAQRAAVPSGTPLLLCVAMMRAGDKLASYRVLGQALAALLDRPWRLVVAGDGPARGEVDAALAPIAPRVIRLGRRDGAELKAIYAAADLYVWPAVGEAYGVALLEAQAAGLAVIAGDAGGVGDVVSHGESGLLTPVGDPTAFASAIRALLTDPARRRAMGEAARARVRRDHDVETAAAQLRAHLAALTAGLTTGLATGPAAGPAAGGRP